MIIQLNFWRWFGFINPAMYEKNVWVLKHNPVNFVDTKDLVLVSGIEDGDFCQTKGNITVRRTGMSRLEYIQKNNLIPLDLRWREVAMNCEVMRRLLLPAFPTGNENKTSNAYWFDGTVLTAGSKRFGPSLMVQGMFFLHNKNTGGQWEKGAAMMHGDISTSTEKPTDSSGYSLCVRRS